MPVPDIANAWKCSIQQSMGTTDILNVIHIGCSFGEDPQDIADAVGAAWKETGSFTSIQTIDVQGGHIVLQPYDGASAPTEYHVDGFSGDDMSRSEDAVPIGVAGVVTLRTGVAGRSHRGRMYIAGISRELVSDDSTRWNLTADSNALTEAHATFLNKLFDSPINAQLVYSPALDDVFTVASGVFRPYFGSQRRRTHASF